MPLNFKMLVILSTITRLNYVKTTTPTNRKTRAEIVALRSYGVPIKKWQHI